MNLLKWALSLLAVECQKSILTKNFTVDRAFSLAEIQAKAAVGDAESLLLSVDRVFEKYPAMFSGENSEKRIRCGGDVPCKESDGLYRVYSEKGEFLMLGRAENGRLYTVKSFFEV